MNYFHKIIKNKFLLYIFLTIILFTLIFYYFNLNNYNLENFENKNKNAVSTYYKCDDKPISPIIDEIFKKYNITHINKTKNNNNNTYSNSNKSWELYMPCGYNYVESELPSIKIEDIQKDKQLYIFGINGCDKMVSKNNIWATLKKYYSFDIASTIMPSSYVLDDYNDMKLFERDYKKDKIYIMKKNVQRKEGLKLTKDYNEIINGPKDEYKVVQNYIRDLYLINGYKVNLRIYLLVIIQNDKKDFYISNLGKCIYTKKKYNDNDLDFESNITSYHLDMNVYKENPRTFDDLRSYINKKEDNPNAGSLFFVKINNILQKMCVALSNEFYQSDNIRAHNAITFQLFGVDVIMDKDLNPFILEVNKGPDMSARDDEDKKMKSIVQTHMFEKVGVIEDDYIKSENVFQQI